MTNQLCSTGVRGLDEILNGGLPVGQAYLVRGGPGCGKTTLGWHFLTTEITATSNRLFISLGESGPQLARNGQALGFSTAHVHILDLSPGTEFFVKNLAYDLFSAAEIEASPLHEQIIDQVERLKPDRIFVDSMTQFRYLASDPYQFRKQAIAFLRFLTGHGATVLFTSEGSQEAPDEDLQFISDGIITLQLVDNERSIHVAKLRGGTFWRGHHAMRIGSKGLEIFPKLLPAETDFVLPNKKPISAGIPEMDELLNGGLERGTVTIITGPSGVGKTTLGLQFIKEAAGRGERSVVYVFEEAVATLLDRCEGVNIPVRAMVDRGTLSVIKIEALAYSPDEFANLVRLEVEQSGSKIVMLDSISGYKLSFRGDELTRNLHGLCQYLKSRGVTMLLVNEVESITGDFRVTELGISYLADNIVFLRYLEVRGQLRRAIGVLKKRLSDFEKTLREVEITRYGIKVGQPLTQLRGILSGVPEFIKPSNDA